jgi:hypothetical protein
MPSVIDTKINLAGLEEVKAKLQGLGADGESAMGRISGSTAAASEGTSKFSGAVGELGEKLGLPVQEAGKLGDVLGGLNFSAGIGGLATLGAAIVAAGAAFLALGEHAATATRAIANQAETLGTTVERFEGLQFAAASVGVSGEAATRAFDRLYVKIGAARVEQEKLFNGGKEAFDSTKAFVDQLASAHGDVVDVVAAVADKFAAIDDAARRADLGKGLFGKGWAELSPLLNRGADDLRKFVAEWQKMGITATEAEDKMASGYMAASEKLKKVTEGLTNAVGNVVGQLFTPGMDALAKTLSDGQAQIREFAAKAVTAVTDFAAVWGKVMAPIIAATWPMLNSFFQALDEGLTEIQILIRDVFGGEFSKAAIVAVGSLVLVANQLGIVSAAVWAIGFAFGSWTSALISIGLIGAAIFGIATNTKELSELIRKYIGEDAAAVFDGFAAKVSSVWAEVGPALKAQVVAWKADIDDWARSWNEAIDRVINKYTLGLAGLVGLTRQVDFGGGGDTPANTGSASASPFAGGGRVPGRGFADTVRALLTPGEFVQRVAAVDYYGANFMRQINNLEIPRFDVGGLVGSLQSVAPVQHFADGGLVAATRGGGGSPVHLHLDGQEYVMNSDHDTVARLVRGARSLQTRSAGKMPGWTS